MNRVERRQRILNYIGANDKVFRRELSEVLGLCDSAIERTLRNLRDEGKVEKVKEGQHLQRYRCRGEEYG